MEKKNDTIRNKIALDGEAEYRKQLAAINREIRESKSAMRAAASEYAAAGGDMEAMRRQGDALESTIKAQEAALGLMREQLGKVEEHYGTNSREAAELRTRINNLRSELARSRSALRDYNRALEDGEDALRDAGNATQETQEGIRGIGDAAQSAGGGVQGLLDKLGQLGGLKIGTAGIAAGAAAAAGAAFGAGAEQTRSEGQLAAYTGATGAELESLVSSAKEIFKEGYGESLEDVARSVGVVATYAGAMGEELEEATQIAYRLDDVFGMDIPESARTARQMMEVFGITARDAYALVASGAQDGADKNGNLLDTINEYAPYYAKAGKSAEEFIGTLTAGAQSGIYDIDKIGDAFKEFTLRIGDGSESTTEALRALGLEAADLPGKFAMGGETASAAFDLTIAALARMSDPLERQKAGIALFGTQWEDTGGAVLEIFASIASNAQRTAGALDALTATRADEVGVQLDRVVRRAQVMGGEAFEPLVNGAAHALDEVARSMDEGDLFGGIMRGAVELGDGLYAALDQALERAIDPEAIGEAMAALGAHIKSGMADLVQELDEGMGASGVFGAAGSAAANEAAAVLRAELEILEGEIARAMSSGDNVRLWTLEAQKAALLEEIALIEQDAAAAMQRAGEEAAAALEATSTEMEDAAKDVSERAVEEIEAAEGDMEAAGEMIGESAADGAARGMDGMDEAGRHSAAGLIDAIRSSQGAAYSAGVSLGASVLSGYKNKMMINSPSLAMKEAGEYTAAGLFESLDESGEELRARGASLAQAVFDGYGSASPGAAAAARTDAQIDYAAMGEAVAQAIAGMTLGMDARRAGDMLELYVSQAERRRASDTTRGAAGRIKGWR